ncbi:NifU family protein [Pyrinomonas sp.]|uniref:NifU family protein n=1 Tax=Pyrinomonas sp. TaxID=2080306 RepID=UPI003330AD71
MNMELEVRACAQRVEELVQKIEGLTDASARQTAIELAQELMRMHGAAFERMLEIAWEQKGQEIIEAFARDELVSPLLLLYDLHPLDAETRVLQAIERVRPYLRSHGGDVELLGFDDGVVRLKLRGSCHGCASSAQTLRLAIETAICEAAPEIKGLEVEGVVHPTPPLVSLESRQGGASAERKAHGVWEELEAPLSLTPGTARVIEARGRRILLCRFGDHFFAYADRCPACDGALDAARLEEAVLACPACGQRYDVIRAGRASDGANFHLEPLPLLLERGRAKVALPS